MTDVGGSVHLSPLFFSKLPVVQGRTTPRTKVSVVVKGCLSTESKGREKREEKETGGVHSVLRV